MILRRALYDAVKRELLVTNPARITHAAKRRPVEPGLTCLDRRPAQPLPHRHPRRPLPHRPLARTANTGMRRGEIHETRGKSRTARRNINLDPTTVDLRVPGRQRRTQ